MFASVIKKLQIYRLNDGDKSKIKFFSFYRAHEILLDDEKQDGIKFNPHSSTRHVTNFTKSELDRFRHEEDDDDEDNDDDDECEDIKTKYIDFENGLKLRVKPKNGDERSEETLSLRRRAAELVMTETGVKNMNKIVMAIVTDCCVMIEGELSTGKTSLVETLARKTNNKLIKYQMDEYMDSKVKLSSNIKTFLISGVNLLFFLSLWWEIIFVRRFRASLCGSRVHFHR